MSVSLSIAFAVLLAISVAPCGADDFLKKSWEEAQSSLSAEIESALGVGAATSRLEALEKLLHPMFIALPKNEHGGLGHATVRYALHRLFVHRHGWSIKGIDPAGDPWNSSSPAGVLEDIAPAYIQDLFEKRLGGHGLGLHELALLAATIEHSVHSEAVQRLQMAMRVFSFEITDLMTLQQADEVLDAYLLSYILSEDLSEMTPEYARDTEDMPGIYGSWVETREFVHGIRRNVSSAAQLSFTDLMQVVDKVGEQFGKFQDGDCRQIKARLVAREEQGNTGRVLLADFYRPEADGEWQFREHADYLRDLGVLDESDPKRPRVIVANYIESQSNCIASSSFYEVCCMNECEGLLGHLEEQIAAPDAEPIRLLSLVAMLPSSSVRAPRQLSETLSWQLHSIASQNGGSVPLHGRLFAQWMHHAFPRECRYPHIAGTTKPRNPDEWDILHGREFASEVSDEELLNHTAIHSSIADESDVEKKIRVLSWSSHEELLVDRAEGSRHARISTTDGVGMLLCAAVLSGAFGVMHMVLKSRKHRASEVQLLQV